MKKPRVLLDVDGVLADFVTPALEVMKNVTGKPLPEDVLEDWDIFRSVDKSLQSHIYDEFKKEGWCYALKPYPGAIKGVSRLREIADVYFVTSPMHGPHWAYERTKWLIDLFNAKTGHVISTNAKYVCRGNVLIDDKTSHIVKWGEHHPDALRILWKQPYNEKDTPRGPVIHTNDWDKAHEAIRFLVAVTPERDWA